MADKKIRWGVISTANIGRARVIPAIQASRNGEMAAVASRDPDKARAFAERLGIPKTYPNYEALLEDAEIDAVYIPLPNSLHREWAVKSAQAGKHILCEKPLAMNAQECLEMEAAARQAGVLLMEAFMYRFHPRTERVLQMVRSGELGDLHLIHSAFTFRVIRPENIRLNPELGGGSLMDVGCYCVNLSRTVAGCEPEEVQAFARWSSRGVDEQLVGSLRFPNGILAQFDSALTLERREEYQLAGTQAVMAVPDAFLPGESNTFIRLSAARQEERALWIDGANEYRLMVEHFADCIQEDKAPRYPASEAADNMRVIEALYRSARNGGKPERVEP